MYRLLLFLLFSILLKVNNLNAQTVVINDSSAVVEEKHEIIKLSEFADTFYPLSGYNNLNMGKIGQLSHTSKYGLSGKNTIPIFNDIPLNSKTFGSWNLFDIPSFSISEMNFNKQTDNNYSDSFGISTETEISEIPESKIYYNYGDYSWNHVDVMLKRRISENLSIFAAGSKSDFPGENYSNEHHGSKYWLNLNYNRGNRNYNLSTFLTDNKVKLPDDILFQRIVPVPNTNWNSRTKFLNLQIRKKDSQNAPEFNIYYWNISDFSSGESLYLKKGYDNSEHFFGVRYFSSISKWKGIEVNLNENFSFSRVDGNLWGKSDNLNSDTNIGMEYTRIPNTILKGSVGSMMDNFNTIDPSGMLDLEFNPNLTIYNHNLSFGAGANRKIRIPSISEKYNYYSPISFQQSLNNETIDQADIRLKLKGKYAELNLKLLYNSVGDHIQSAYENRSEENNIIPFSKNLDKFDFFVYNLNFRFNWSEKLSFEVDYIYNSGDLDLLFTSRNNYKFTLHLTKLEDYFTQKKFDTRFSLYSNLTDTRRSLIYLPNFRFYTFSDTEITPSIFSIKLKSQVTIKSLTIFHEIDYHNQQIYQYALGYTIPKRMIRMGVEWHFKN